MHTKNDLIIAALCLAGAQACGEPQRDPTLSDLAQTTSASDEEQDDAGLARLSRLDCPPGEEEDCQYDPDTGRVDCECVPKPPPVTPPPPSISESMRTTYLFGESIWTERGGERDLDNDGLKDDFEPRLADVWKPYFIYDEWENYTGDNTPELSLQSWEPRTLLQVHPVYVSGAEVRVRITYGILHRMDGGYRNDNLCTNHHSGDTQNFMYYVRSYDSGVSWRLETVQGWEEDANEYDAGHRMHEWTAISGDFERPRLKMYLSAGKHHPYPNGAACEDWDKHWCDDDCGGGEERMANLHPWEYYTNVGEPGAHPMNWGLNQPFVNELFDIGYPHEFTWYANWETDDCGDIFTGGMNSGPDSTGTWDSSEFPQAETCVTPVYGLFPWSPL